MLKKLRALLASLWDTPPSSAIRRRFVPGLESLEDRTVPATFLVTTPLDVVNPTDGKLSLREAINRANAHPGADTIILPAGVYRIARPMTDDTNAGGDFDVHDSTLFQGAGAGKTIIDGQQIDRVFDILGTPPNPIKVTLQGLTIRNGLSGDEGGGGIRVGYADLMVQNCAITGNRTFGAGGGISNESLPGTGNVKLIGSSISGNVAKHQGGGLFVEGNAQHVGSVLNISGSTIQHDIAGQAGGGIFARTLTLTGSTVRGNHAAQSGGGIDATTATLNGSTVSGNSAGMSGGGIHGTTVILTRSSVSGNSAGSDGGGIVASQVNLTGSTISGNHADVGVGGGIAAEGTIVIGCTVSGNSAGGDGGGIDSVSATLKHSTVRGNFAGGDGGGIGATVSVALVDSTVSGNFATNGGGIHSRKSVMLTSSTVNDNHALTGDGGGVSADTATLTSSTVRGNTSGNDGGGISVGTAMVTSSTVSDNSTRFVGGGISATSAMLTGSTISGNTASNGGGLEANSLTLTNCTVSGNQAIGGAGGGLDTGALNLLNVTITDNSAHDGGGVFLAGGNATNIRNSIIAGNFVDFTGDNPDVSGVFNSGGHNLIGVGTGSTGFVNGTKGDQVGTTVKPIDPRLAPLANNGGSTKTRALLPASPAIDHGDNTDAPATDQRGVSRPRDGDGNGSRLVDIGAFER